MSRVGDAVHVSGFWFKPRRYGYGATPTTWQGWALVAAYVVALWVTAMALIAPNHPRVALFLVATLAETALFLLVCRRKTEGAWHWRWGKE